MYSVFNVLGISRYKKSQAIQMREQTEGLDKFYLKCYNNSTKIAFSQSFRCSEHLFDLGAYRDCRPDMLRGGAFLVHSYFTIFQVICKAVTDEFLKIRYTAQTSL